MFFGKNDCEILYDFVKGINDFEIRRVKIDYVYKIFNFEIIEEMIRVIVEEFLVDEDFKIWFFEV